MRFYSVAGKSPAVDFPTALLQGLAPDGGLYVPEKIPRLQPEYLQHIDRYSLHEIASEIFSLFLPEFPHDAITGIVQSSLTFPIPLVQLEPRLFLLELFHGPTLAFKDVGARCMANMLSFILGQHEKEVTILVATSGDTGSAVAHGFFDAPHITVFVLYPSGRISKLQEQQMATLGGNINAVEIEGNFDDCQRLVKQVLVDPEVRAVRDVTTANSMNFARLLPQIVYYAWAFAQWKKNGGTRGAPPVVVVPSGNFGNLTAAVYAKQMGIPISQFIAATNANDVFRKYLETGEYLPVPAVPTLSNAMDVGSPSNLSRLMAMYGNDVEGMRREISAESFSDQETLHEIAETYRSTGYTLDPHTAIGVAAARKRRSLAPAETSYIIAATAHPAKFRETIQHAIGVEISLPSSLRKALSLEKKSVKCSGEYTQFRKMLLSRTPYHS